MSGGGTGSSLARWMSRDVLSGLFLLAIAAGYYWAALGIPRSSLSDEVGAAGLPTVLAVILAALGLLIVVRGLVIRRPVAAAADAEEAEAPPRRAFGLLAIGAAYVFVVPYLGYVASIALLIAVVAIYEGLRPSWRLPAIALAGAAFLWVLFVKLLGVQQPPGLFL